MADQPLRAFDMTVDPLTEFGLSALNPAMQSKLRELETLQALVDRVTFARGPVTRQSGLPASGGAAAARAGVERFTQNAANLVSMVPNLLIDSPAMLKAAMPDIPFGVSGQSLQTKPGESFGPTMPQGPVRLSAAPVMAGIDMAGEAAGALRTMDFGQFSANPMEAAQLRSEAMGADRPVSSALGEMGGDVASLLTLRSPFAESRGMAQWNAAKQAESLTKKGETLQPFAPSAQAMLKNLGKNNESAQWITNRIGRAGEAGIEGAAIGIMNDGDPLETAAYSAGVQAAGSLSLGLLGSITNPLTKNFGAVPGLAFSALLAGNTIQVLNSLFPGGRDRILESQEAGANKIAAIVALGLISGAVGSGRIKSDKLTAFMADQATAALRGGLASVMSEAGEDRRIGIVLNQVGRNPEFFGTTAARRMERAFRNPNISITGVIDDLMESDREFRTKYMALERNQ
jgi:hypothetical protein